MVSVIVGIVLCALAGGLLTQYGVKKSLRDSSVKPQLLVFGTTLLGILGGLAFFPWDEASEAFVSAIYGVFISNAASIVVLGIWYVVLKKRLKALKQQLRKIPMSEESSEKE